MNTFLPVDADDLLPENASISHLNMMRSHNADLIFGKSKRWDRTSDIQNINAEKTSITLDDPLAFCALKKIVHMVLW